MEIQKLLDYYINSIASDIDIAIKEFQTGYEIGYETIHKIPQDLAMLREDSEKMTRIEKLKNTRGKMLYVGYPIYIDEKISKNNKKYRTVEPIFLIPVVDNKIAVDKLKINKSYIDSILKLKSNLEAMNAILEIYKDISFFEENVDYIKCIENIYTARKEYPFKEKIQMNKLSKGDIEDIKEKGIYNKAALFVAEKSKYTEGLEKELIELKSLCKVKTNSVLDLLVNSKGYIENNKEESNINLLEVLNTNREQKEAIKKALSSKVTVIKGPPGTGKSQVVTNLIINAIYNEKTVLFSSKNHKAVDVVCDRINKVSKYPIMMNIKSSTDITSSLIPYLDSLINSNFKVDINYYKAIVYALNNKARKLEKVDLELEDILNKVERLKEYKLKTKSIRKKVVDINVFKNNIEKLDEIDFTNLENLISKIYTKGLINKIKIGLNRKNIISEIKDNINSINEILKEVNVKDLISISDYNNIEEVKFKINEYKENLNDLNDLADYYRLLEEYNRHRDIVDIIKEANSLEEEYILMSKEVCNKFLEKKSLDLTYQDKQNLISYKNMLSMVAREPNILLNKAFLNNYNDVNYRINKIIPAMAITSLSIRGKYPLNPACIDLVVIDEATQCDIASAIPLLYRAKSIVVIGDDKQLEHITKVSTIENVELLSKYDIYDNLSWDYKNNSIYSLIESYIKEEDKILLKEHHRSHKDIIDFSNNYYYGGNLRVATKYSNLKQLNKDVITIKDVKGKTEKYNGASAVNKKEAEKVIEELRKILNSRYRGSIGIITPFRGQAEVLNKLVSSDVELSKAFENNDLLIDTVNKFQGDEKDLIIFSLCVSNNISDGAINFLKNTEKLFNVALTRAKANLVLVCDTEYISQNTDIKYLKEFFNYKKELEEIKKDEENFKSILENTNGIYPKFNNIKYNKYEKLLYEKLYENNIKAKIKYPIDGYYVDLMLENNIAILVEKDIDVKEEIILINKLLEEGYIVKKIYGFQIEDSFEYILKSLT